MKNTKTRRTGRRNRLALFMAAAASLCFVPAAYSQGLGWEGETGVFVTPLAYTAPSAANKFGEPAVAYHYLNGGNVLGDFHEVSITEGALGRLEFGYTRALHTVGDNPTFSPLWHNGFNIFHGKVNLVPENSGKRAWLPAISAGFILRTQVRDVGAAIAHESWTNGDVYLVASKTVTQSKIVPIVLSAGVRGTNAELWGMGGNAPDFTARGFGALAFVFKGPAHSAIILATEFSQQPRHPEMLPTAIIPTTFTYAVRLVPVPERRLNFDFGIAQIAGKIAPGVDLRARAQIGVQASYGF